MQDCFVIFGAAVREDGSPSGTLRRRVEGAHALSRGSPSAVFLVTGGQGRFGQPEALVMRDLLLQLGVPGESIILEDKARDTLESILFCTNIIKRSGEIESVTVCSSPYHILRCQVLFWLKGIRARRGRMPSDRSALGWARWLYYWLRDFIALPWDVLILLLGANRANGNKTLDEKEKTVRS